MIQKETETAEIANTKKVKCSYKFEKLNNNGTKNVQLTTYNF